MFASIRLVDSLSAMKEFMDTSKEYFIACAEGFDFEGIKSEISAKWMGAVFPGIFAGKNLYDSKAFVCELTPTSSMQWIGQDDMSGDYKLDSPCKTYMVVVDGFNPIVSKTVEYIYDNSPENTIMFGGGAGCLKERAFGYMYDGKNYTQRGMILLSITNKVALGARHGYRAEKNYFMITKSEDNKITRIDGRDAFEFYADYINEYFHKEVTEDTLFEVGLQHPFMFEYTFGEKIVRVPMCTDGKALFLSGEVSKEAILSMGTVQKNNLLSAAKKAAQNALEALESKPKLGIVFSCLGRKKLSVNNFQKELDAIAEELSDVDFLGFLSIGEIANNSTGSLEYYNCTCVVGVQ